MLCLLSLALCFDTQPAQLLTHELAVATERCSLLEREVELGELAIAAAQRDKNAKPATVAIAAARQGNTVAKLQAQRAQLKALQSLARVNQKTKPSALVFAVPGFSTHSQLVPISRLLIDTKSLSQPFLLDSPTSVKRQGLRNSEAWTESLRRSTDSGERLRLQRSCGSARCRKT